MDISQILSKYDKNNLTIAVLGSHSALDVCRGAKNLGFKTLVIVEKGRGKTYSHYFKTNDETGCVDEVIELNKFSELLNDEIQEELRKRNSIFIPHRSFEVYINDYDAIEIRFEVPMFGNRYLLRSEERGVEGSTDQYAILNEAGIKFPLQIKDPKDINTLVIVKVLEKERGFERAFFLVNSFEGFKKESERLISEGKIAEEALEKAVIEEFVIGVQVNFNFFFSPISHKLELLGTDTRRQTNLDGLLRIPENMQELLFKNNLIDVKYEEAGHIAVTVLESMLEKIFDVGEKFVEASKKLMAPGVIGPFGLQSMIVPGPPKKDIVVFDVSPRMPGSPGISATPYSGYLYGDSISAGMRVAMEIKKALDENKLEEVVT